MHHVSECVRNSFADEFGEQQCMADKALLPLWRNLEPGAT